MPKRNTSDSFELFFSPRFPLFFLLGALLVAVMGNVASDLVKSYLGDERKWLWLIFIGATAALGLLVYLAHGTGLLRAWLQARQEYRFLDKPSPASRKGLIAYVSLQQRAHLEKAIAHHRGTLAQVWLIATAETQKLAGDIVKDQQLPGVNFAVLALAEPWDPLKAQALIENIYQTSLGALTESEVIADFTGGTKPMTVGMVFACLHPQRALQYVPAAYGKDGDPAKPLEPVEYRFDAQLIGQQAG